MVLDVVADSLGATFKTHKARAMVAEARVRPGGGKVILAKPMSFMNLSGQPVAALASFYNIPPERIVVVHDELDIPFDDAQRHDMIIARLLDGKPMAVRDKGPLFIIYPFDARPELRNTMYFSRSAWQLRTIEVL